ncbi:biotin--[acetyl-CoA-carboxylase] ligase [Stenoxybacter acetivorans]|uniref:biotin--[acetyl-CoA-carboxylase] ligase n=1 Tax=Stenoxybacter acetivorans TaxID=422441 RepID=UPI000560A06A|nr:biotin--[acetyl-CoA-carboxylase] ligase [Stenoxybacter acetivorans]
MSDLHWVLLPLLADGLPHSENRLAQALQVKTHELFAIWQQVPPHIRGLLRRQGGVWHLVRPLAILSEHDVKTIAAQHGFQAALLTETTSTNTVLLNFAKQNFADAHAQVRVAYQQSEGRGRQGKAWEARSGECLMMSLSWLFNRPQADLSGLAAAVALAACRALRNNGVNAQIKWPNDLVLGQSKLGGILIETVRLQSNSIAVIGIGLNFVLPKQVDAATAIQTVLPKVQAVNVYHSLLSHLAEILPQFNQHGLAPFLDDYHRFHRDQNQAVRLLQQMQIIAQGKALGINENGMLRLHTASGEKTFANGDISLRTQINADNQHRLPEYYLLLDSGNSKLKWAWAQNGRILCKGAAAYHELYLLRQDWQKYGNAQTRIIGCAVSGESKQSAVEHALPQPIEWLSSEREVVGIRNHYRDIQEHGADRWFNVLGSRRTTANACVIVSCGTAVTVDALTDDNQYLGGSILPGFHLMTEALALHTAKLNRIIGKQYPFATTTANALASGIADAVCGAVLLMHQRLQDRVGAAKSVDVLITGGGGIKLYRALPAAFVLDNRTEVVDNLAIQGLLYWVENE